MSKFCEPLDEILATRSKVRALRTLASAGRAMSGREVARLAGLSVSSTLGALGDLAEMGVVHRTVAEAQHLYQLARENQIVGAAIEPLFSSERERVKAVYASIAKKLARASERGDVDGAYLYGSAARGDDLPESDFDVLVVTPDQRPRDGVLEALDELGTQLHRRHGLALSRVVLSRKEARRMSGDGLVREVLNDGRVICGRRLEDVLGGSTRSSQAS